MTSEEIVSKLRVLRRRLERDDILSEDLTVTLLLCDVCETLGLDEKEQRQVMGAKATRQVELWKDTIWYPVETETATIPSQGLIAVPV